MHYACVHYKDRCDQSIRYQKRKDFRELLRIQSQEFMQRTVDRFTAWQWFRHTRTNNPFRLCLPIVSAPLAQPPLFWNFKLRLRGPYSIFLNLSFVLGLGLTRTTATRALPGEQLCHRWRTTWKHESSEVLRACPQKSKSYKSFLKVTKQPTLD